MSVAEDLDLKHELSTFEFEVVVLDAEGNPIEQGTGISRQFIERISSTASLDMVEIPGGSFLMGSPEGEGDIDERPVHLVSIPSFFMGKYLITQVVWRAVAGLPKVNRDLVPSPSHFEGELLPVETINWFDAVEFCARLTQATGRTYRLPSEAEWEYACRAGTTTPFGCGETLISDLANFDASCPYKAEPQGIYRARTVPVGVFGVANEFGLYDMHGNVWEWCQDVWHDTYEDAPTDGRAWLEGGKQELRVLRGGSWDYAGYGCRCAFRDRGNPKIASPFNGLRVVASVE